MKIRDKRTSVRRGDHVEGTQKVKGEAKTEQVQGASSQPLVENEAGGSAAKAALRALAMDADSDVTTVRTKGGDAGLLGAKLMSAVAEHKEDKSKKSFWARGAALGALGISLMGMAQPAAADVVYLDFNNGVEEIKTARRMAQESGEDFHLVRPTKEALEATFAQAEAGEIDLSTLILSGHSLGTSVWGSGPEGESHRASIEEFKELKEKYPKAFEQVEHVFFMACYAGGKAHSASWNEVFPNARAVVGFYGSGPASHRPASSWVMENVENALNNLPDSTLSPQQALLKAKQIASLQGPKQTKFGIRLDGVHYQHGAKQTSNAELVLEQVQFARNQTFTPYFEATAGFENTPTNHQVSPLRDYYNQVQAALNQVEPGSPEAQTLNDDIKTTIRLIYFDNVAKNVEVEHRADFKDANAELAQLGIDVKIPPDLRQMTRAEVLELKEQLQGVEDAGPRLHVLAHGGAVADAANAWLEARGEEPISFAEVEDIGDIRSQISRARTSIERRTFDAGELTGISEVRGEVEALRDMDAGAKSAAVKAKITEVLAEARAPTNERLAELGVTLRVPEGGLDRDGARELAGQLRQAAAQSTSQGSDGYSGFGMSNANWRLTDLAGDLEEWAGAPSQSDEQLLLKDLVSSNGQTLRGLANKLERLEAGIEVPTYLDGDAQLTAAQLATTLKTAEQFASSAEAAPAELLASLDELRAEVDAARGQSAVDVSAEIFDQGLYRLTPEAVPDNWITD